ncbi:MAG: glycosyl hydrolase [Acidimicrobiales bacterium]|jgi:hypothetical protein
MAETGPPGSWRDILSARHKELTVSRAGHAGRLAVVAAFVLSLVAAPGRPGADWLAVNVSRPIGPGTAAPATPRVTVAESKKGVCVWAFKGVNGALKESGANWYLTWSTTHDDIATPRGTQFVPMVLDASSVTAAALAQAEQSGPALLTFNEPDLNTQADMTVRQALSIWPKLMATNLQLASPAVAAGAADTGGWLDRFMKGIGQRHYRVNFIAIHWYGGDFQTRAAVAQLKSYLEDVHRRYDLPVWLTEFALIDFSPAGPIYPTSAEQAAFVTAAVSMLDDLAFVKRYAWFALPAPSSGLSSGLYTPGPRATVVGRAFERA